MSLNLNKYFIYIALIIVVVTILFSYLISEKSSDNVESEVGNSLSGLAYQMADKLDLFMWAHYNDVRMLSSLEAFTSQADEEEMQILIDNLQSNISSFSWIGVTDANGTVQVATNDNLEGIDVSERPVFKMAQTKPFIGDVHEAVLLADLLPNPNGEDIKFVDISVPLYNENNDFMGVFATHLSWEWVEEVRNSIFRSLNQTENERIEIFVISSVDDTVLLGPSELIGKQLNLNSIEKSRNGVSGWLVETWDDGADYLTGYAYGNGHLNYQGLRWTVLVRQPQSIAFEPAKELKNYILLLGIITVVFILIVGFVIERRISKPLISISVAADKLKKGESNRIPYFKGVKEIEVLSVSLQNLFDTLARTKDNLEKMVDVAHHDKLTGLPNRNGLDFYLEKALADKNETLVFLYLDLDGFKGINDTFGHQSGDLLLQEVAHRLKNTVQNDGFISRIGGDEFIVILPSRAADPIIEAEYLANRIIKSLNAPVELKEKTTAIGCSIGGAVHPYDHPEVDGVLKHADKALYISKAKGKNQMTFYKKQPGTRSS